jgi:hypothetical protein
MSRMMSHSAAALLVSFTLLLIGGAAAANDDTVRLARFPNSDRVLVNGHWWQNPLRMTARGALSDENSFSAAFRDAGNVWTTNFCNEDSDGDGFTNGEELGDPDCLWFAGSSIEPTRTTDISHPGLWSSVPSATYPARSQTYPMTVATCSRYPAIPSVQDEREAMTGDVDVPSGLRGVTREAELATVRKPGSDDGYFNDTVAGGCPLTALTLVDWHDPAVWGGALPAAGTNVTLPAGVNVLLTWCSVPDAGFLKIVIPATSTLVFDDAPIHLRVRQIDVQGKLLVGGRSCPIQNPVTISFVGTKAEIDTYNNGINIYGTAELHGAHNTVTWTRLKTTATAGVEFIVVQDDVEWSAGDEIVIVTSIWKDHENDQNEVRRITRRKAGNATVLALDAPLSYRHFGGHEYQSEVALLSRSILLRGGLDAEQDRLGYGGHTLAIGPQAVYRAVGVRAERMGQRNVMARYPFHFHMMYDSGRNSSFQQNACVHSYFRCFTVHGTNYSLVRKNVAFNSTGHTYYLEDGGEMFNTIEFNIAAKVNIIGTPAAGGAQSGEEFISDAVADLPADHAASGFYLSNAHNWVRGNAASGGWSGYAFPVFDTCLKLSAHLTVIPKAMPVLEFDANTAHSSGFYWGDGGCIYAGGKLWMDTNVQKLRYTNGRVSHPTVAFNGSDHWQQITNLRTWLCQKGYSSWGDRVDLSRFECHDCTRSAVLFGTSSIVNAIVNGISSNRPEDMLSEGRQGFGFYDTWVQTMLVNVTFRNIYPVKGESIWSRNGVLVDLTHSDMFKPWGISATRNIRFENVDRSIIFRRWVRESGSSRMFNVMDWDGSLSNSATCQGQIIGSDIDWWNGYSDCWYERDWQAWICPRKPGREVVGLDIDLPGIQQVLDIQPDETNQLTQEQRDQLYIGHLSYFGSKSAQRLIVTRNHHFATGLSATGWYMYLSTGVPQVVTVYPKNFPRGAYILLAISYPADATFTAIYVTHQWDASQRIDYKPVSSREAVLSSNGTYFHWDGRHLYLKISDMHSKYPNQYTRSGVDIYSVASTEAYVRINASCPTKTGSNCLALTAPDPPSDLATGFELPLRTCATMAEFQTPTPLCPQETNIRVPTLDKPCNELEWWECMYTALPNYCRATCLNGCRRFAPYPYNCSLDRGCATTEKPKSRVDWCEELTDGAIVNDPCTMAFCNGTARAIKRLALPEQSACSTEDAGGVILDARCAAGTNACSGASQIGQNVTVYPLNTNDNEIVASIRVAAGTISSVQVEYRLAHDWSPRLATMALVGGDGATTRYTASGPANTRVAGAVKFTVVTTRFGTKNLTITDWARSASRNPSIKVASVVGSVLTLTVQPSDFVQYAEILTSSTQQAGTGTVGTVSATDTVQFPTVPTTGRATVRLVLHNNVSVNMTLPCLAQPDGNICANRVVQVQTPPSSCAYWMVNTPETNAWYAMVNVYARQSVAAQPTSVTFLASGVSGADVQPDRWGATYGGQVENINSAKTFRLTLSDGTFESFRLPYPLPAAGASLACISGVANEEDLAPRPTPGAGVCISNECVNGDVVTTTTSSVATTAAATATVTTTMTTPAVPPPAVSTTTQTATLTSTPAAMTPTAPMTTSAAPPGPNSPTTTTTSRTATTTGPGGNTQTPSPGTATSMATAVSGITATPIGGTTTTTPNVTGGPMTTLTPAATETTPTATASPPANTTMTPANQPTTSTVTVTPRANTTVAPPTTASLSVIHGTFRLNGTQFAPLLSNATATSQLLAALITDIAALLRVASSRIVIIQLSLGSLVIAYSVTPSGIASADAYLAASANATVSNVQGRSDQFPVTESLYQRDANTSETLTILATTVTVISTPVTTRSPPGGTTPTPQATDLTPRAATEGSSNCGTMCGVFIAVAAACGFAVVGAVVFVCLRRSRASADRAGQSGGKTVVEGVIIENPVYAATYPKPQARGQRARGNPEPYSADY